jgi:hypothetical protein
MVVGRMPGGNFDYELEVLPNGTVRARGPLDAGVSGVKELCIWVFQKIDEVDAIAYAMSEPGSNGLHVETGPVDPHWKFPLPHKHSSPAFAEGSATAMGIGVFLDRQSPPRQTVYWWSEAVTIEFADDDEGDEDDD